MEQDKQKKIAAQKAAEYIKSGMKLGLGTGSTVNFFLMELGKKIKQGLDVIGVPTSNQTEKICAELGIQITNLKKMPELDLTVDGADEIDQNLNLTKGGGGALLREKIVANASKKMIVIADESKLVQTLGKFPLPIEVTKFGAETTKINIEKIMTEMNIKPKLSMRTDNNKQLFVTDNNNYIIDAQLTEINKPHELEKKLNNIPGVVENGLFVNLASQAIISSKNGVSLIDT